MVVKTERRKRRREKQKKEVRAIGKGREEKKMKEGDKEEGKKLICPDILNEN